MKHLDVPARRLSTGLVIFMVLFCFAPQVVAAVYPWIGTTGSWNDNANWNPTRPEAQFGEWSASPKNYTRVFRVRDRYGDYGLTGLASFTAEDGAARVTDFLLSCRVMGRQVEKAMLSVLAEAAHSRGLERLIAQYGPTDRNAPCLRFFAEESGFERQGDVFTWRLARPYQRPLHVAIQTQTRADAPVA